VAFLRGVSFGDNEPIHQFSCCSIGVSCFSVQTSTSLKICLRK